MKPENNNSNQKRVLVIDTNKSASDAEQIIKGLASEQRLRLLKFLGDEVCSINDIASALNMPASTVTLHINSLETSGLIKTEFNPRQSRFAKSLLSSLRPGYDRTSSSC